MDDIILYFDTMTRLIDILWMYSGYYGDFLYEEFVLNFFFTQILMFLYIIFLLWQVKTSENIKVII